MDLAMKVLELGSSESAKRWREAEAPFSEADNK